MDCTVGFERLSFWERLCTLFVVLIGGTVTFPNIRLLVNGKPLANFKETVATGAQQAPCSEGDAKPCQECKGDRYRIPGTASA